MSDALRTRLQRLVGNGAAPKLEPRPNLPSELSVPGLYEGFLEAHLGGSWQPALTGPAFVVDYWYGLTNHHGRRQLDAAFVISPLAVERLARLELGQDFDLRRAVFLDIESTGLVGGSGTLPFLIGVGKVVDGRFLMRQYLLPDPALETPMLEGLSEFLSDASALVTFNGRSFDVPMIETRYVFNRLRSSVALPNIDLLAPSRRIWRGFLSSCRLISLEEHILDFERGPDIPGGEIPGRYFRYLRDGRVDLLQPVLRHNVFDVLSMVTLIAEIGHLYEGLPGTTPRDHLISGRLWEVENVPARAVLHYERALSGELGDGERIETLTRLALLYRRLGRWGRAAEIWQEMVDRPGNLAVRPYLDLANYHERRLRDFEAAIAILNSALDLVRRYHLRVAPDQGAVLAADIEARLTRIEQKKVAHR